MRLSDAIGILAFVAANIFSGHVSFGQHAPNFLFDEAVRLIASKADPRTIEDFFRNYSISDFHAGDRTPLIVFSVEFGDLNAISVLLDFGFDINAIDPLTGRTAAMTAAGAGRTDVLHVLLNAGANPNVVSQKGETLHFLAELAGLEIDLPRFIAPSTPRIAAESVFVTKNFVDAVKDSRSKRLVSLVESGLYSQADGLRFAYAVNPPLPNGITLLHIAVLGGHAAVAQRLIDHGASVDAVDLVLGWSPLMLASYLKNADMADLLVSNGADTTLVDKVGRSVAQLSIATDLTTEVAEPRENIPPVSQNDLDRLLNEALFMAAEAALPEVVEQILAEGADVNSRDSNGWTSMMYLAFSAAPEHRVIETADVLFKARPRPDLKIEDPLGNTALSIAITRHAPLGLIQDLIQRGGISPTDGKGKTYYSKIARKSENHEASALLPPPEPEGVAFPDLPSLDLFLKSDMSADDWRQVQLKLQSMNLYKAPIDGDFGSGTRRGLTAYYSVMLETLREIGEATCTGAHTRYSLFKDDLNALGYDGVTWAPFGNAVYMWSKETRALIKASIKNPDEAGQYISCYFDRKSGVFSKMEINYYRNDGAGNVFEFSFPKCGAEDEGAKVQASSRVLVRQHCEDHFLGYPLGAKGRLTRWPAYK